MKRNNWLIFGLLLLGTVLHTGDVSAQNRINRRDRRLVSAAESVTGDRFTVVGQTPQGARVFARKEPTAEMLKAIDTGLSDLFAVAERKMYRARLQHSDYTIFIARADRDKDASNNYSPDIEIGAAQYAGSVYDQGGYIYAAGMVVAFDPCAFVVAEHTKQLNRVSDVVRYEGEHLVLFHNDQRLYQQTLDHSQGGGHPILK